MRLTSRPLSAGILALLVACGSKTEREAAPAPVPPPLVKSVEERLFPAAPRRLLDLAGLALLPADTRALVVVARPAALSDTLGLSDDEAGAALGRAIARAVGFDILHPDSVPELGVATDEPVAVVWPRGSGEPRLLVFSSADPARLRAVVDARPAKKRRGKRAKPRLSRVFARAGMVALILGEPDQELVDSLGAVAGGLSLTETAQFVSAASAVDFGGDFAAYLAPDLGKLRALAVGGDIGEHEVRVMAAAVVAEPDLDRRAATWIAEFSHRLGVDTMQPGPQPRPAVMADLLAAPDAAAVLLVAVSSLSAIGSRPHDKQLARQTALRDAAQFGMIGMLSSGTSKAAENKRAELAEVDGELAELRSARDEELARRRAALIDGLGHLAMVARADLGTVVVRGGMFTQRPLGEIVDEAVALWYLGSPHSAPGSAIAGLEVRRDKLGAALRRISDKQFASMFGSADFSSGLSDANIYGGLLGDEVGEMQGGFGLGVSGVGPGGGGTGWGTIGIGKYGTIGHGGGGGTGYGSGSGRGGRRGRVGAGKSGATPAAKVSEGKLDRAEIRGYIGNKRSRIDTCAGSDFHGKLTVRFVIRTDGWAEDVRASGGDDDEVRGCLEELFTTFPFPAPAGGEVKVSYPIVID